MNSALERVGPAKSLEATKIGVRGAKLSAVLDGERRKVCIACQVAGDSERLEQSSQNSNMTFCGVQDDNVWSSQPSFYDLESSNGREWVCEYSGPSRNSNECNQSQPGEANGLCSRKCARKPRSCWNMIGGVFIDSVDQKIGVGELHRRLHPGVTCDVPSSG